MTPKWDVSNPDRPILLDWSTEEVYNTLPITCTIQQTVSGYARVCVSPERGTDVKITVLKGGVARVSDRWIEIDCAVGDELEFCFEDLDSGYSEIATLIPLEYLIKC